jgi:hypothetical protein
LTACEVSPLSEMTPYGTKTKGQEKGCQIIEFGSSNFFWQISAIEMAENG